MPLTALERLQVDLADIIHAAGEVQRVLGRPSTKRDLEYAAYAVVDFRDSKLRPHLEFQGHTLLAVAREHLGHGAVLREIEDQVAELDGELESLLRAVELGQSLRLPLEAVELALRDYADHEERVVLPWAKDVLGDRLLREVQQRAEPEAETPLDLHI